MYQVNLANRHIINIILLNDALSSLIVMHASTYLSSYHSCSIIPLTSKAVNNNCHITVNARKLVSILKLTETHYQPRLHELSKKVLHWCSLSLHTVHTKCVTFTERYSCYIQYLRYKDYDISMKLAKLFLNKAIRLLYFASHLWKVCIFEVSILQKCIQGIQLACVVYKIKC